jgi:hypothetical protein
MRCFSEAVGGVSVRKIPIRRLVLAGVRGFTGVFICRERSFPDRFVKISFGSGCDKNRRDACSPFSGVFENQDAAIIKGDFLGAPCRALIDAVWVEIGGTPSINNLSVTQ